LFANKILYIFTATTVYPYSLLVAIRMIIQNIPASTESLLKQTSSSGHTLRGNSQARTTQTVEQLLRQTSELWRGSREAMQLYGEDTQRGTLPAAGQSGDLFSALPMHNGVDIADAAQSTGHAKLDALLPGGGWPKAGLVEVTSPHKGIGELQLLMPLLRQRSQQAQSVLWIAPPYALHGSALAEAGVNIHNSFVIPSQTSCHKALWSIEKALQSSECGLVLAWQNWLSPRVVRRLQLAAREGQTLGMLFHQRPTPNSPAMLQLAINSAPATRLRTRSIDVHLMKATGSHKRGQVRLELPC
jgi:cell division inhibitor SulA